jgi:hypothetical protein
VTIAAVIAGTTSGVVLTDMLSEELGLDSTNETAHDPSARPPACPARRARDTPHTLGKLRRAEVYPADTPVSAGCSLHDYSGRGLGAPR